MFVKLLKPFYCLTSIIAFVSMELLFIHIRFLDILDIVLVAGLLYAFYNLLRGTGALNILMGLVSIYLLWRVVRALDMILLSEILGAFIGVGMVALLVVFQPEIRKFLLLLGKQPRFLKGKGFSWLPFNVKYNNDKDLDIDPVVKACLKLSREKTGALIVFSLRNNLSEIVETGTTIKAAISEQLLCNIFFKNSPLHDGALIISDNRIEAAGCILPVSDNLNIDPSLGLRHRAAIGLSEQTDAICVVVSEETGNISFVKDGEINRNITPAQLQTFLKSTFILENES